MTAMTPRTQAVLGMLCTPADADDRRTSMADWRTALCLAIGVPLDLIDPATGHDLTNVSTGRPSRPASHASNAQRPRPVETRSSAQPGDALREQGRGLRGPAAPASDQRRLAGAGRTP